MVIKPFSHLARQGFAKTLVHGYAQSAVAASQSSYATNNGPLGQFHNYPAYKFARTTQLQNGFQAASSPSSTGVKADHAGHGRSTAGDGTLAAYFAAWQYAQQTGDESDWRQHQFSKKIEWKPAVPTGKIKRRHQGDFGFTPDSVPPFRASTSEADAEAPERVNVAIAQHTQCLPEPQTSLDTDNSLQHLADGRKSLPEEAAEKTQKFPKDNGSATSSLGESTPSLDTGLTSPVPVTSASDQIVELARSAHYSRIPALFEHMLKGRHVPTVEAYNSILLSAIHLTRNVYQALPKALEIYGDMVRRQVTPNEETHIILINFLSTQALDVYAAKDTLRQRQIRFGGASGSFLLKSSELEHQLLAEDSSLDFALQQYQTAKTRFPAITMPSELYCTLIQACAQHSRVTDMVNVFSDMARKVTPPPVLFTPMITAFAEARDLRNANKYYEEYRALAIANVGEEFGSLDKQDITVYAALIKAFLASDNVTGGFQFFDRISKSYESSSDPDFHKTAMESSFCRTFVDNALRSGGFEHAIAFVQSRTLDQDTREQILSNICAAAADANNPLAANSAFELLRSHGLQHLDAESALLAANLRAGNFQKARTLWNSLAASPQLGLSPVELTTMYTNAALREGVVEETLLEARAVFQRVRDSAPDQRARAAGIELIDEALVSFSENLMKHNTMASAQAKMHLIRMMLENGGLVSPAAEHAIASVGPESVDELNAQDISLALHVQAGMLSQSSNVSDPAHLPRFAYLLEIVLSRGIPLDPSTVHAVTECSSKLSTLRPDLARKWRGLLQPASQSEAVSPVSSVLNNQLQPDGFDPYAQSTDFRASSFIAEQLEITTGRLENHLSNALSRLRDVRRAGRHPRYATYAKLITAAGKTGQVHLVHEILGMARHDVPMNAQSTAVKVGWVAIFDAMLAACLTTGERQLASAYHQELLDMGAAPSANTFGLYITTLKESTKTFDEATEAVKIFQRAISEGVEPGVFLYNAVIGKLGKARRIDDCLFYFGDMQSRKIRPTSVTYGTLVNALCRTSEERFAEEMFDEMESMPNYRPKAAPYNSIIQFFLNTKRDRSKVLAYFERMKAQHIKPTSHTFKLLIEAYASLEPVNLEAAEAVLIDMKAARTLPEAVHYGSLIHARGCVLHDMIGARALFDSVLSSGTIRPTDNLYQNLFEAMVANHEVAGTKEVLVDMAKRNVEMTAYIANTLIHGWAAQGAIAEAELVYDKLGYAKREPSTYEAMTRAYLSIEDREKAHSIVQEMLSKKYPSAVAEKVLVLMGGVNL